jgi:hypothetical protein
MERSFACPECGCEIRLTGLSPGRLVRCDWCKSQVEVPFLPRSEQIKRMRRSRRSPRPTRLPAWAWGAVVVLSLAIGLAGANRIVRSSWRSAKAEQLAKMIESSREAEASGRLDHALAAMEGALAFARRSGPELTPLDALQARRDGLARREAEALLARLESDGACVDPARSVGEVLTLLERTRRDRVLAGLEDRVHVALDHLRLRWAEADAKAAREALEAGDPVVAMDLCERLARTASALSTAPRKHWHAEADALARQIIERHGAVIEPVRGQFSLGSPPVYAALLRPVLSDALRRAGYLPRPATPSWDDLWSTLAPCHLTVEVRERQEDTYLQSFNRLSQLESTVTLSVQGQKVWHETHNARTQIPMPGLSAYQASRLAVGSHRSPDFERLLYENARGNLIDRLGANVRNLPARRTASLDDPPIADPAPAH